MGIINLKLKSQIKCPDGVKKAAKNLASHCNSFWYSACPLILFECPFRSIIFDEILDCSQITEDHWIKFLEYMNDETPRDLQGDTLKKGDNVIVLDQNKYGGKIGIYDFTNHQSYEPHYIKMSDGEIHSFRNCRKINDSDLEDMKNLIKEVDYV